MTRPLKSNGNFCMKCDRSLQDSFLFCSISCKIHHLVTSKSGIVNKSTVSLLFDRATSVSSSEIEDAAGQMTPASLLDFPASSLRAYACTAAVDQPVAGKKKKRRVLLNPSRQRCSTTNRRKSVPNRAPLN
ncbi:b box-type domain-containing protein [Citrus sinensis]|nr:b box-type domain-containing protein [Citrus sinensis]